LRDYLVNLSGFEERSILDRSDEVTNQISDRIEDEFLVVVKSIPDSKCVEKSEMLSSFTDRVEKSEIGT
jgi:hypothetical protein